MGILEKLADKDLYSCTLVLEILRLNIGLFLGCNATLHLFLFYGSFVCHSSVFSTSSHVFFANSQETTTGNDWVEKLSGKSSIRVTRVSLQSTPRFGDSRRSR